MFDSVRESVQECSRQLRELLSTLDSGGLDDVAASGLVEDFVMLERLAEAGRLLAAAEVTSDVWRRHGFRSAAAWMAAQAARPVGPAIRALEMVRLLDDLPALSAAFRSGELSVEQANEIADAASEDPDAEQRLLDAAGKLSLAGLREECRRVKAAAAVDEEERYRKLRRGRYLLSWTDRDGAVRLSARLTPDEGARLLAAVNARQSEIAAEARAGGWFEGSDAHRADALVELANTVAGEQGGTAGPQAAVHVWVDYEALVRGWTMTGECCEIPGIGPIPVALARRMLEDSILKVIVTKGVDITTVAHAGRTIAAHMRTAVEFRDPTCIVPGCEIRHGLEIDHRPPWTATRITTLEGIARLCKWHHYEKSHLGATYRGGPGTWEWVPAEIASEPPSPAAIREAPGKRERQQAHPASRRDKPSSLD